MAKNLGTIFDFPAILAENLLLKLCKISLKPSTSRFGFQALLFTFGLFFVSLFLGEQSGGCLMWWTLWLGITFIALAIYFSMYFLRHQPEDQILKKLEKLDKLDDILSAINNLATQIRLERESRNGKSESNKPDESDYSNL